VCSSSARESLHTTVRSAEESCGLRHVQIIDYDRIAVLDQGVLKEYDSPANLIDMPGGIFRSLVDETGATQVRKAVMIHWRN
jgi:hypothetical protein